MSRPAPQQEGLGVEPSLKNGLGPKYEGRACLSIEVGLSISAHSKTWQKERLARATPQSGRWWRRGEVVVRESPV